MTHHVQAAEDTRMTGPPVPQGRLCPALVLEPGLKKTHLPRNSQITGPVFSIHAAEAANGPDNCPLCKVTCMLIDWAGGAGVRGRWRGGVEAVGRGGGGLGLVHSLASAATHHSCR
jgi:hypothetical protein